jgi:hypothetical protein
MICYLIIWCIRFSYICMKTCNPMLFRYWTVGLKLMILCFILFMDLSMWTSSYLQVFSWRMCLAREFSCSHHYSSNRSFSSCNDVYTEMVLLQMLNLISHSQATLGKLISQRSTFGGITMKISNVGSWLPPYSICSCLPPYSICRISFIVAFVACHSVSYLHVATILACLWLIQITLVTEEVTTASW